MEWIIENTMEEKEDPGEGFIYDKDNTNGSCAVCNVEDLTENGMIGSWRNEAQMQVLYEQCGILKRLALCSYFKEDHYDFG